MAEVPAPIVVIRQKLTSANPDARVIALSHAKALGSGGRALAVDIAWCLEDDDEAVSRHAVAAFEAVAREATDAVPVLLELRERGAPKVMVARATRLLGHIGPSAIAAIPALLPDVDDPLVLHTLLMIDPYDPTVVDATISAALGASLTPDLRSWLRAEATNEIVERLFAEIEARLPMEPHRAASALGPVVGHSPERSYPLLRRLLANHKSAGLAVAMLAEMADPPSDLVDLAIAACGPNPDATLVARLGSFSTHAAEVKPILLRVIHEDVGIIPTGPGPVRIQAAATALAASAPTSEAGEPLRRWLGVMISAPDADTPWEAIGGVIEALALMDPSLASRRSILLALDAARRNCLDLTEFHGMARRAIESLPDNATVLRAAAQLGMPRAVDAPEAPTELPDFPDEPEAAPEPWVEPIEDLTDVREALVQGLLVLGLTTNHPLMIVAAVQRWLQGAPDEDDLESVAVAYGEALRKACGWKWCVYHEDDDLLAVVSPDGRYVLPTVEYLGGQLAGEERTVELLFEMIASDQLPPSEDGSLTVIG